jgi:hypothetical protein
MIDSSEENRRSLIPALFAMADWMEMPVPWHKLCDDQLPALIFRRDRYLRRMIGRQL